MSHDIRDLIAAIQSEALRDTFPIDTAVYEKANRDPLAPILWAGSLVAPLCIVGRDLGKDEVRAGQPLIGAAGRLVRAGIARAWDGGGAGELTRTGVEDASGLALGRALLTNLVPFKPPGNKAYSPSIRERFRPFLDRLLVDYWSGHRLITLGAEAFQWFKPYASDKTFESLGAGDARFGAVFPCRIPDRDGGKTAPGKDVMVYPLPHPSPLNRRWFSRFPAMLAGRLAEVREHHCQPSP